MMTKRWRVIGAVALTVMLAPPVLGSLAPTPAIPTPLALGVQKPAIDAYFESRVEWQWVPDPGGQGDPFVAFTAEGYLAHEYETPRGNTLLVLRNASDGTLIGGGSYGFFPPSTEFEDEDAPGPDFVPLGANRLAFIGYYDGPGPRQVRYTVVDYSNGVNVSERALDTGDIIGASHASVATDPGGALSVVAREQLKVQFQYVDSLVYSRVAANASVEVDHLRLLTNYAHYAYPQILFDPASGGFVVAFEAFNDTGVPDNGIMGIAPNGSVRWGPVVLANISGSVNVTVDGHGTTFAAWAEGDSLLATALDTNGSTLAWRKTLLTDVPSARFVRPFNISEGDFGVVWADATFNASDDVALGIVRDFFSTPRVSRIYFSQDDQDDAYPRAVQGPAGDTWITWVKRVNSASRWGMQFFNYRFHTIPFEVEAPAANLTVARGDSLQVPLTVRNTAGVLQNFTYSTAFQATQGPSNWTITLTDASNATPAGAAILSGDRQDLTLTFRPPLVDPPGYAARFTLFVQVNEHPEVNLTVTVNVSVYAGHRLELSPGTRNVTALPGSQSVFDFSVLNNGSLPASNASLMFQTAPPSGWTVQVVPSEVSLIPGASANVTVTVSVPADASSVDFYCSVLRVQNADPLYRPAAPFCVQAALVSTPTVGPPLQGLLIDPGGSASATLTVANLGNSAAGLPCSLVNEGALAANWAAVGTDWTAGLPGGAGENVTITYFAPSDALGGSTISANLSLACGAFTSASAAQVTVEVRGVHQVSWRFPGSSTTAGPDGIANFTVTLENGGNVPETVTAEALSLPPGWSVDVTREAPSTDDFTVAPFSAADFNLSFRVGPVTLAGSYTASARLTTASGASREFAVAVSVSPVYGLAGEALPAPSEVYPGETVPLPIALNHPANAQEFFTFVVTQAASTPWASQSSYEATNGSEAGALASSSLTLAPFSSGTLFVTVTVPRFPRSLDIRVQVALESTHGSYGSWNFTFRVLLPDFAVSVNLANLSANESSASARFIIRVSNMGVNSSSGVPVRLELDGTTIWTASTGVLSPGEVRVFEASTTLGFGNHTLRATVDPADLPGADTTYGAALESNESNNVASLPVEAVKPAGPAQHEPEVPSTQPPPAGGTSLVLNGVAMGGAVVGGVLGLVLMRRRRVRQP